MRIEVKNRENNSGGWNFKFDLTGGKAQNKPRVHVVRGRNKKQYSVSFTFQISLQN